VITEKKIYEIDRLQFVGYAHSPLYLSDGSYLEFAVYGMNPEPTLELACASFDNNFPNQLGPGMILWLDRPQAIKDLTGWKVHCRYALTDEMKFTDSDMFVDPPKPKPKHPMMTQDEMLYRT
jgi:hypothetical protein